MDPDPDPGGPKTYRSDGSGSATLILKPRKCNVKLTIEPSPVSVLVETWKEKKARMARMKEERRKKHVCQPS
jgi:hypothetical protein